MQTLENANAGGLMHWITCLNRKKTMTSIDVTAKYNKTSDILKFTKFFNGICVFKKKWSSIFNVVNVLEPF